MSETIFQYIFLAGIIAAEVIRFPHRQRNKRERLQRRTKDDRTRPGDFALDMLAFAGMEIIPLVYIFSSWLDFADYTLPLWASWLGVLIMVPMLWLLWKAHADLGQAWTPTVEITEQHKLVTSGIYARIRHPIYAAIWLWGIAQALLLPNWLAGWSALAQGLVVAGPGVVHGVAVHARQQLPRADAVPDLRGRFQDQAFL